MITPPERVTPDAWLEQGDDPAVVRIHGDALTACRLIGEGATSLLPGFVSDRYSVTLVIRPVNSWATGQVDVQLIDTVSREQFPVTAAADGYRLWIQLALLEVIDRMRRQWLLFQLLVEVWLMAKEAEDESDPEDETYDAVLDEEREMWSQYAAAMEEFRSAKGGPPRAEDAASVDSVLKLAPRQATRAALSFLAAVRPRVYFIDEPERHLHPGRQRSAARWLADVARTHPCQVVVATHSVPFLGIGPDAQLIYVRRQPGSRAVLDPITRDQLVALATESLELGLDRGELLALTSVLLFVEGRGDQVVLETLIGRELANHGITVVPMHSASRASGVLTAETLLRFTTAAGAVWLDNVPTAMAERLGRDLQFAHELRADKKADPEARAAADLRLTAHQLEREITILPHPGTDIFDLLDEDVIRLNFPLFPGHSVAREEALRERKRSGMHWKPFYLERYEIDVDVPTLRLLAEGMRGSGAVPNAVRDVVNTCEMLALSSVGYSDSAAADW
jgi:hypothetical protein